MPERRDAATLAADELRQMRWLFVLCLLAVTHGSLYPWLFHQPPSYRAAAAMLFLPTVWTGGGDVVANVLLFMPVGALGWLSARDDAGEVGLRRQLLLVIGSLAFAFLLQVAQIWLLPARVPAISDVLWNAVGLGLGLRYAQVWRSPLRRVIGLWDSRHRVALALAGFWLTMVWWPLLPQLNRGQLRLALFQLRHMASADLSELVLAALALAVVVALLQPMRSRVAWALGLVAVGMAGKFIFAKQAVTAEQVYGWLLGLVLGMLAWRLDRRSSLQAMLAAAIGSWVLGGLGAFTWLAPPTPIHWVPFQAALTEPRVQHSVALGWSLFWLSAMLVSLRGLGMRLVPATAALALAAAVHELAQRWVPGQQADITPLLMLPLLALVLDRLEHRPRLLPAVAEEPAR